VKLSIANVILAKVILIKVLLVEILVLALLRPPKLFFIARMQERGEGGG